MVYSYGVYGQNNKPNREYYLNSGYDSFQLLAALREDTEINMDLVYELWENVKAEIKKNTSETVYAVWFDYLKLDSFDGETVVLNDDPFRCKI